MASIFSFGTVRSSGVRTKGMIYNNKRKDLAYAEVAELIIRTKKELEKCFNFLKKHMEMGNDPTNQPNQP